MTDEYEEALREDAEALGLMFIHQFSQSRSGLFYVEWVRQMKQWLVAIGRLTDEEGTLRLVPGDVSETMAKAGLLHAPKTSSDDCSSQ